MVSREKNGFAESIEEFFSSSTVMFFICEASETFPILSVSRNVKEILGFERTYFINNINGWSRRVHPEDRDEVNERFLRVYREGGNAINEYRFKRKDGTYIWLRDEIKRIKDDGEYKIYGSSFDITGRKKAELSLEESKKQYQSVVEHIKDITFSLDNRGHISFLNSSWDQRTAFSIQEAMEMPFEKFVHPEDREGCQKMIQRVLEGESSNENKMVRFLESGENYFWAEIYCTRLEDEFSDDQAITGTIIDVSQEIAQLEEREAISEQLEKRVEQRSKELHAEIKKRKAVEENLQQRLAYEHAIAECSSLLLKDTSDESLEQSMKILRDVTGVDRAYLYKNRTKDGQLYPAPRIEVYADGIKSVRENLDNLTSYDEVPYWYDMLSSNKTINARIGDLPEQEQKILRAQNVKSVLVLPLAVAGEWYGYIGFSDTEKRERWEHIDVRLLETARDIISTFEKRKQIEQSLLEQRNYTETLLDSLPSIYLLMDQDLNLVQWNQNVIEATGYTDEEIEGKSAFDLLAEENHEHLKRVAAKEKIGDEGGAELKVLTKDGRKVPYFWHGELIEFSGETYLLSVGVNISKQKETEQKLMEEKRFNEALIESLPGIFYMIDSRGNYLRWNNNFEKELGYSAQEIKHMTPKDFYTEEEFRRIEKEIENVFVKGKAELETKVLTRDGRKIPYYLTGKQLTRGDERYLVGVGYDITEQKKYEKQLSSSLKEKNVLLQEIHHRVKNNLAVISGLIQLQIFETEDETVKSTLRESENRIQTMALIHEKLYRSQDLSQISCDSYIGELVDVMRKTIDIRQDVEVIKNITDVKLTITQAVPFALLVNEVVTNAFKHAFSEQDEGLIEINISENDDIVHLRIEDNGIGLPEDFTNVRSESLGMNLIRNFISQLDAEGGMGNADGAYLDICFTKEEITELQETNESDS